MRMQLFLVRSNKWWVGSPLNINDCRYKRENSSIAIQKRKVLSRIHTFAVYREQTARIPTAYGTIFPGIHANTIYLSSP